MIINETFFQGPIKIDGLLSGTGTPAETKNAITAGFNRYVEEYEPEYLKKLLGDKMSRSFTDYIYNRTESTPPIEKWDDLYDELVKGDYSPIAEYIYFFYSREQKATATPLGTTEHQNKPANPSGKMIGAWNRMALESRKIVSWIKEREDEYADFCVDRYILRTIDRFGI